MYGGTPLRSILHIHIVHRLLGRGCFPSAEKFSPTRICATLLWHGSGSDRLTVRELSRESDSCTVMAPPPTAPEILVGLDHGQVKLYDEGSAIGINATSGMR